MAWSQTQRPGFQQLDDSSNPMAQAYARQALARNGIHVPPGADAASMWRQFSQNRALQQNEASFREQQNPPGIDPGIQAAMNSPQPPQVPQASPDLGPIDPAIQAGMNSPQAPHPGIGQLIGRLPDGGYRQGAHALSMNGLMANANNQDWRMRIAQMASALKDSTPFHALQGGPAEAAMHRLVHVNQAHRSAAALAHELSARRPSRKVPRSIKAY